MMETPRIVRKSSVAGISPGIADASYISGLSSTSPGRNNARFVTLRHGIWQRELRSKANDAMDPCDLLVPRYAEPSDSQVSLETDVTHGMLGLQSV